MLYEVITGCILVLDPATTIAALPTTSDGGGFASLGLPVPAAPQLPCAVLFAQAVLAGHQDNAFP